MIEIIQTLLLVIICWFLVVKNMHVIADQLVIPQFIINELQLIADGNDSHKRERARFGLDVANQMQDSSEFNVVIDRSVIPGRKTTDDKLIVLARKLKAQLYTTDYNLSKVASLEGVSVLNVNELSQSLRPVSLPGESLSIKIIQKGNGRDQGVGYLDDGTMIVVDGAARYIGKVVPVTVTRMHQTVAGKMVFGQVRIKPQAPTHENDDYPAPKARPAANAQARPAVNRQRPVLSSPKAETGSRSASRLYSRLQKLN